jgi:cellulose 1,4-beta-cellobiosidase
LAFAQNPLVAVSGLGLRFDWRSGPAPFGGDEIALQSRAHNGRDSKHCRRRQWGKAAATPQSPPTLSAAISGTTVSLSWSAVPGATSYRLRAGSAPGASNIFDANVGNITALTAGASPGTYYLRVHALVGGIEGGASNEVRIDIGGPGGCVPPAAPTQLTPSIAGASVRLTWDAVAGETSYVIEVGSSSGLANLLVLDIGTAVPSFNGVGPPGSYFVRVRARGSCGLGPPSNEVIVLLGS